jgi:hypothetical protein
VYTVIEWVLVAVFVGLDESVAVSVTVNDPAVVYVWLAEPPVPVVPSPKFQMIVKGSAPPVVIAVNVTGELTMGVAGRNVKLVDSGGVGWTVTVSELVALWEGEAESVAVSVTVKD